MTENIFEGIPNPNSMDEELVENLCEFKNVRIERIVSTGQTSGWYNQDEDEWVCLVQGNAEIEYENGEKVSLKAGDTLFLKAHVLHRVSYTSKNPECIWICVFAK